MGVHENPGRSTVSWSEDVGQFSTAALTIVSAIMQIMNFYFNSHLISISILPQKSLQDRELCAQSSKERKRSDSICYNVSNCLVDVP